MIAKQLDSIQFGCAADEAQETLLRKSDEMYDGRIMIVDDEPINIKLVQKYLRDAGYQNFVTTTDSRQAVELIHRELPDVIVLDVMMPHVSGLNILEVVRSDRELANIPVLFLTASTDEQIKSHALELGATDFLTKPVKPTELIPRIKNSLILKAHQDQLAAYSKRLEFEVRQRTEELLRSREEVIHILACAAEYRDHETGNHVIRVGRYAGIIAKQLGCSQIRCDLIAQAAILHDVGKIGIPDSILHKPSRLESDEMQRMQSHCEIGMNILRARASYEKIVSHKKGRQDSRSESPILGMASKIAMSHHEKWDGSGYPNGLAGEAIPIEGRITAVADVFDALSSRRPYKEPLPFDKCFEILEKGRQTHFDPKVIDAYFARIEEVLQVALELVD